MSNSRTLRARIIASLAVVALLAACSERDDRSGKQPAATGAPATKLSVGVFKGSSALPMFVAHSKGFFKKHNIDSTLVPGAGAPAILSAVLGGTTQVGLGVPSSTFATINQDAAVGVLPPYQSMDFELLALDPGAQGDIKKLAGKTIGVTALGGATDVWLRDLLKAAGMNPAKDVTIIASGGMSSTEAALRSGSIHAAVITGPLTPMLEHAGLRVIKVASALKGQRRGVDEWGIEIMWVGSRNYFQSNPRLASSYCAAMADTIAWMADPANSGAGARLVEEDLGAPAAVAPAVWETASKLWSMKMDESRWKQNLDYYQAGSPKTQLKVVELGC